MSDFYARHAQILDRAIEAIRQRTYWSAYPESASPKIYGETARAEGEAAFKALLGKPFPFDAAYPKGEPVGAEKSPHGLALDVKYYRTPVAELVAASKKAGVSWGRATPDARAGALLEILQRLNQNSFLIANAVSHVSGQAFPMAFQAGGPHAQDRALEAIAYAMAEMRRIPTEVLWEKSLGKGEPLRLNKKFRLVPRGVAVVVGCATFPTWNTYPGLFASLATGNSVIVKPHPDAILPMAITIKIMREALSEAGFDPNVVLLAVDDAKAPITQELVAHEDVKIVDFTGGPQFGAWLRNNLRDKLLYTEEAGLNAIVIDSTAHFQAMCDNIAFSLSLYSGQMCTAPQNIFIPKGGVETDEGHKSFDEVASGITAAIDRLLSDSSRALGVLGAIQSDATLARIKKAESLGRVVRASGSVEGSARTKTPTLIALDAEKDEAVYSQEHFGPIAFAIATASTQNSLSRAAGLIKAHGGITAALYSTDENTISAAEDAFAEAKVSLAVNFIHGIFVNQSAAYSDYHVTGGNPAGTASLSDSAFVANRFRVAPVRRLA